MSCRKRNPFKLHLGDKVGVEFNAELDAHPLFHAHPRAILAAQEFLGYVAERNVENAKQGKPTGIHWEDIRDLFRTYVPDVPYTKFRDALVELGLLEFDPDYVRPTLNASGEVIEPGKTMTYRTTAKALGLLNSAWREYWRRLHSCPVLKRKVQKRISKNRIVHQQQETPFLIKIHRMRLRVSWDYEEVADVVEKLPQEVRTHHYRALSRIREKEFSPLSHNEADHRVWSELTTLPSILRPVIRIDGKSYIGEIDQRACHPSFLGHYLFLSSPPIISIYDRGEGDKRFQAAVEWSFFHSLFIAFEDPRPELGRRLKLAPGEVKERLIHWLNGKDERKLKKWFRTSFPVLNEIWQSLPPEPKTGPEISRLFETRIWQDIRIYEWLDAHGMAWIYGNDGISLFGDPLSEANEAELFALIQSVAKGQVGHQLAIKFKRHTVGIAALIEERNRKHHTEQVARVKAERNRENRKRWRARQKEKEELRVALRPVWDRTHGGPGADPPPSPPPPPPPPPPPTPPNPR